MLKRSWLPLMAALLFRGFVVKKPADTHTTCVPLTPYLFLVGFFFNDYKCSHHLFAVDALLVLGVCLLKNQ